MNSSKRQLANLRPFNTLSPEERKRISSAGAVASAASRKRKKEAALERMIELKAEMMLKEDASATLKRFLSAEEKIRHMQADPHVRPRTCIPQKACKPVASHQISAEDLKLLRTIQK